jgi:diacylglycerol kinase family enzyme
LGNKILLIVNETASSVTARGRVVIQKALGADHEVRCAETTRRGHATSLARGAVADGTNVVVVLGGDGTLNEAANGLVGSDVALAPLPGGSTNVFARSIGLPDDPAEATAATIEALEANSIRRVGLGSVNGRYFLFHVGMGFDAAVVEQVEKRGDLKRYLGHPLFVYAAVTTWARHYDRRTPSLAVRHRDGGVDDGYFALCLNTNPYTYLGDRPLDVAPEATLDRGLVCLTLRSLSLGRLSNIAATALRRNAELSGMRGVDYATDLDDIVVEGHGPFPYQVDGDHLGDAERLHITHEADILDLVVPTEV